jgi:hypothetical protein
MSSTKSEGEKRKAELVDISTLDLYHLLQFFITLLSEKAWRYMGLKVDPRTNELETDFNRAKIAIDCIIYLEGKLDPNLTEDDKNRFRNLITDLQINYARQVKLKG